MATSNLCSANVLPLNHGATPIPQQITHEIAKMTQVNTTIITVMFLKKHIPLHATAILVNFIN